MNIFNDMFHQFYANDIIHPGTIICGPRIGNVKRTDQKTLLMDVFRIKRFLICFNLSSEIITVVSCAVHIELNNYAFFKCKFL